MSHMLRFYGHPIVEPGGGGSQQIDSLRRAAQLAARQMVIFPEGTRTRDGEIGSFKSGGLKAILASRPWLVYLVVSDGFWRCGMLSDLARNVPTVRGRIECLGPFPYSAAGEDEKLFIDELRSRMCLKLQEMRGQSAASQPITSRGSMSSANFIHALSHANPVLPGRLCPLAGLRGCVSRRPVTLVDETTHDTRSPGGRGRDRGSGPQRDRSRAAPNEAQPCGPR